MSTSDTPQAEDGNVFVDLEDSQHEASKFADTLRYGDEPQRTLGKIGGMAKVWVVSCIACATVQGSNEPTKEEALAAFGSNGWAATDKGVFYCRDHVHLMKPREPAPGRRVPDHTPEDLEDMKALQEFFEGAGNVSTYSHRLLKISTFKDAGVLGAAQTQMARQVNETLGRDENITLAYLREIDLGDIARVHNLSRGRIREIVIKGLRRLSYRCRQPAKPDPRNRLFD